MIFFLEYYRVLPIRYRKQKPKMFTGLLYRFGLIQKARYTTQAIKGILKY